MIIIKKIQIALFAFLLLACAPLLQNTKNTYLNSTVSKTWLRANDGAIVGLTNGWQLNFSIDRNLQKNEVNEKFIYPEFALGQYSHMSLTGLSGTRLYAANGTPPGKYSIKRLIEHKSRGKNNFNIEGPLTVQYSTEKLVRLRWNPMSSFISAT